MMTNHYGLTIIKECDFGINEKIEVSVANCGTNAKKSKWQHDRIIYWL